VVQLTDTLQFLQVHYCGFTKSDMDVIREFHSARKKRISWHPRAQLAEVACRELSICDRLRIEVEAELVSSGGYAVKAPGATSMPTRRRSMGEQ